jgi:hypothetical protein
VFRSDKPETGFAGLSVQECVLCLSKTSDILCVIRQTEKHETQTVNSDIG